MLPMGTIMTVAMFVGLIVSIPYVLNKNLSPMPKWASIALGSVVMLAGAWNVFWYALQHLNEYWGIAALVSGILMMITAAYIFGVALPAWLVKAKPIVLFALLACMLHYGYTIYSL